MDRGSALTHGSVSDDQSPQSTPVPSLNNQKPEAKPPIQASITQKTIPSGPPTSSSGLVAKSASVTALSMYQANQTLQLNFAPDNLSINDSSVNRGKLGQSTVDEEGDPWFSDEDDPDGGRDNEDNAHVAIVDRCREKRFVMHNDCISRGKLRTIHRGYDNESGCEIAWTTYTLHNYSSENLLKTLERVKEINHKNLLRVFHHEVRKVLHISTAGS